jgi:hypothetical protein
MKDVASHTELKTVFVHAQRIAAALCVPVGPRELLLAAVTAFPQLVVARAHDCGIEVRRLLWALREWGPIEAVDPVAAAASAVTPAARDLLAGAAAGVSSGACSTLIERLLDPAALACGEAAGAAPTQPADRTGAVLSRLKLI